MYFIILMSLNTWLKICAYNSTEGFLQVERITRIFEIWFVKEWFNKFYGFIIVQIISDQLHFIPSYGDGDNCVVDNRSERTENGLRRVPHTEKSISFNYAEQMHFNKSQIHNIYISNRCSVPTPTLCSHRLPTVQ